jgi:hypothetical protein
LRPSILLRIARAAVLVGFVAGCETERQNILTMTVEAAMNYRRTSDRGYSEIPLNPYDYRTTFIELIYPQS